MRKLLTLTAVAALVAVSVSFAGTAKALEVKLFRSQTTLVGTVTVEDDGTDFTVTINTTGGFILLVSHVAIGQTLTDLPQNRSNNPKVGHFPSTETSSALDEEDTHVHTIALANVLGGAATASDQVTIAVHAKVLDLASATTTTIVSDVTTMITATNTGTTTPFAAVIQTADPWSALLTGTNKDLLTAGNAAGAEFIWESDGPNDFNVEEDVSFKRTFTIDGIPLLGSVLHITCDNEYDPVALNGTPIGSDFGATAGFDEQEWRSVETYDDADGVSAALQQGSNMLTIDALNFGDRFPFAMCVYLLDAENSDDVRSAWAAVDDSGDETFEGRNWATWFLYTTSP